MRILWITEFFPQSAKGEITGGVEARCFFVRKYLERLGHQVQVIARPTSGGVWHAPTLSSIPERFVFTLKAIILGLFKNFDIVEGTNAATYLVAWFIGFLRQKPVVFWVPDVLTGTWVRQFGLIGFLGEISDWLLFHLPISKYIAISQSTKRKLVIRGVSPDKIAVVYCAAEVHKISLPKKYDICVVSRLLAYKRVDDLIRAVPRNLKVVIIGQGPEKNALLRLSRGKNITFLGHVASYQKVLQTIASSRILCHPSSVEGFGIAIIEAAALGVPYVARSIPAVAEITHKGRGGLLFKGADLKDKLMLLLSDVKLYARKSREAKELASKYAWRKIARQTEKVYESLLSH